jgi:hypothetical protein
VAYEDRIHIAMGGSAGYPQYLMDKFMRNSIGAIYDDVQARRNGVPSERWAD